MTEQQRQNIEKCCGVHTQGLTWQQTVFILAIVYAAGVAQNQLLTLRSEVNDMTTNRFTDTDALVMQREFQFEIAQERAFSRSLCFAISNLQEAQGLPITNDCTRP